MPSSSLWRGDITFRDRVFLEKIGEYLKNIDLLSLIEDEYRFSSLSDPDSIRVITQKKESNQKQKMVNFGDLGDKYWSDKDGEFFSFNVSPNQSANKDHVNELVDAKNRFG
ncbi:hypothetical protein Tco_0818769 [Tanacetum coccineum]